MADSPVISISPNDHALILSVQAPELDYDTSGKMRTEVMAAGEQTPDKPIVLDMRNVEIVPSVALGALITLARVFQDNSRRFILSGVKSDVRNTLAVCHLDKMFEMFDGVDDVLTQLSR